MAVEILFMLIFLEYLKVISTSSLYDVKIALPVRKAGCLKDLLFQFQFQFITLVMPTCTSTD